MRSSSQSFGLVCSTSSIS